MRAILQPAYILHSCPLNETSLILDVFTRSHGRIRLLAKGARTRFRGLLRPFMPLVLSWSGKTELMHLNTAEIIGTPIHFMGDLLFSGIYLNELLVRLLPCSDPYPVLFDKYQATLIEIQNSLRRARNLRLFEKTLLTELGYGFSLDKETSNDQPILLERFYLFIPGQGLRQCDPDEVADAVFSGRCLLALHHETLQQTDELHAAKRLNRLAITSLLGGRLLKSREFFFVTAGNSDHV